MRGSHLGLFGSIAAGVLLSACATAPTSDTASDESGASATEEIIVTGSARGDSDMTAPEPEPVPAEVAPAPSSPPPPPPPPGGYPESRGLMASKDASASVPGDRAPSAEVEKVLPQSGQLTAGDYDDVLNLSLIHI